jgi:hypothetical protein
MIDTVAVRHSLAMPPPAGLLALGFSTPCGHALASSKWVKNPPKGSNLPRLTWSTHDGGGDWLTAEVSLPKFVNGTNVRTLTELEHQRGMRDLSAFVTETADVDFDVDTALVGRVDYCHCWRVGEAHVNAYVASISRASMPHMKRRMDGDTTVTLLSKSRRICVYGKLAETIGQNRRGKASDDDVRAAIGVLRFETGYRTTQSCGRLAKRLNLADRSGAYLLAPTTAERVIEMDLGKLTADKPIEPLSARMDSLRESFGDGRKLLFLEGFLAYRDRYGDDFWKHGVVSRSLYYKTVRELKDAGLWLDTPTRSTLPGLRLVKERAAKAA